VALLILCEPTSHSTNIYISRSTSRCEVFGTFLHFIRRLLPPSGNDTSALAEGNTRGFCKRTDAYKRMTALYVSFIFPGVFTVYCCPLFTVYCLLLSTVYCLLFTVYWCPLFAQNSSRRCKHHTPSTFAKLPAGFLMQKYGIFQVCLVSVFRSKDCSLQK